MKDKHLPGFILSKAGYKNRIIGTVPTRGAVDADITAVFAFINALTAGKGIVAASIYGVVIFIIFRVAVDKPVAVGRKRNVALWFGKHFGCAYLADDQFLFHVVESLPVPYSTDEYIALVPFGMAADKLLVQG